MSGSSDGGGGRRMSKLMRDRLALFEGGGAAKNQTESGSPQPKLGPQPGGQRVSSIVSSIESSGGGEGKQHDEVQPRDSPLGLAWLARSCYGAFLSWTHENPDVGGTSSSSNAHTPQTRGGKSQDTAQVEFETESATRMRQTSSVPQHNTRDLRTVYLVGLVDPPDQSTTETGLQQQTSGTAGLEQKTRGGNGEGATGRAQSDTTGSQDQGRGTQLSKHMQVLYLGPAGVGDTRGYLLGWSSEQAAAAHGVCVVALTAAHRTPGNPEAWVKQVRATPQLLQQLIDAVVQRQAVTLSCPQGQVRVAVGTVEMLAYRPVCPDMPVLEVSGLAKSKMKLSWKSTSLQPIEYLQDEAPTLLPLKAREFLRLGHYGRFMPPAVGGRFPSEPDTALKEQWQARSGNAFRVHCFLPRALEYTGDTSFLVAQQLRARLEWREDRKCALHGTNTGKTNGGSMDKTNGGDKNRTTRDVRCCCRGVRFDSHGAVAASEHALRALEACFHGTRPAPEQRQDFDAASSATVDEFDADEVKSSKQPRGKRNARRRKQDAEEERVGAKSTAWAWTRSTRLTRLLPGYPYLLVMEPGAASGSDRDPPSLSQLIRAGNCCCFVYWTAGSVPRALKERLHARVVPPSVHKWHALEHKDRSGPATPEPLALCGCGSPCKQGRAHHHLVWKRGWDDCGSAVDAFEVSLAPVLGPARHGVWRRVFSGRAHSCRDTFSVCLPAVGQAEMEPNTLFQVKLAALNRFGRSEVASHYSAESAVCNVWRGSLTTWPQLPPPPSVTAFTRTSVLAAAGQRGTHPAVHVRQSAVCVPSTTAAQQVGSVAGVTWARAEGSEDSPEGKEPEQSEAEAAPAFQVTDWGVLCRFRLLTPGERESKQPQHKHKKGGKKKKRGGAGNKRGAVGPQGQTAMSWADGASGQAADPWLLFKPAGCRCSQHPEGDTRSTPSSRGSDGESAVSWLDCVLPAQTSSMALCCAPGVATSTSGARDPLDRTRKREDVLCARCCPVSLFTGPVALDHAANPPQAARLPDGLTVAAVLTADDTQQSQSLEDAQQLSAPADQLAYEVQLSSVALLHGGPDHSDPVLMVGPWSPSSLVALPPPPPDAAAGAMTVVGESATELRMCLPVLHAHVPARLPDLHLSPRALLLAESGGGAVLSARADIPPAVRLCWLRNRVAAQSALRHLYLVQASRVPPDQADSVSSISGDRALFQDVLACRLDTQVSVSVAATEKGAHQQQQQQQQTRQQTRGGGRSLPGQCVRLWAVAAVPVLAAGGQQAEQPAVGLDVEVEEAGQLPAGGSAQFAAPLLPLWQLHVPADASVEVKRLAEGRGPVTRVVMEMAVRYGQNTLVFRYTASVASMSVAQLLATCGSDKPQIQQLKVDDMYLFRTLSWQAGQALPSPDSARHLLTHRTLPCAPSPVQTLRVQCAPQSSGSTALELRWSYAPECWNRSAVSNALCGAKTSGDSQPPAGEQAVFVVVGGVVDVVACYSAHRKTLCARHGLLRRKNPQCTCSHTLGQFAARMVQLQPGSHAMDVLTGLLAKGWRRVLAGTRWPTPTQLHAALPALQAGTHCLHVLPATAFHTPPKQASQPAQYTARLQVRSQSGGLWWAYALPVMLPGPTVPAQGGAEHKNTAAPQSTQQPPTLGGSWVRPALVLDCLGGRAPVGKHAQAARVAGALSVLAQSRVGCSAGVAAAAVSPAALATLATDALQSSVRCRVPRQVARGVWALSRGKTLRAQAASRLLQPVCAPSDALYQVQLQWSSLWSGDRNALARLLMRAAAATQHAPAACYQLRVLALTDTTGSDSAHLGVWRQVCAEQPSLAAVARHGLQLSAVRYLGLQEASSDLQQQQQQQQQSEEKGHIASVSVSVLLPGASCYVFQMRAVCGEVCSAWRVLPVDPQGCLLLQLPDPLHGWPAPALDAYSVLATYTFRPGHSVKGRVSLAYDAPSGPDRNLQTSELHAVVRREPALPACRAGSDGSPSLLSAPSSARGGHPLTVLSDSGLLSTGPQDATTLSTSTSAGATDSQEESSGDGAGAGKTQGQTNIRNAWTARGHSGLVTGSGESGGSQAPKSHRSQPSSSQPGSEGKAQMAEEGKLDLSELGRDLVMKQLLASQAQSAVLLEWQLLTAPAGVQAAGSALQNSALLDDATARAQCGRRNVARVQSLPGPSGSSSTGPAGELLARLLKEVSAQTRARLWTDSGSQDALSLHLRKVPERSALFLRSRAHVFRRAGRGLWYLRPGCWGDWSYMETPAAVEVEVVVAEQEPEPEPQPAQRDLPPQPVPPPEGEPEPAEEPSTGPQPASQEEEEEEEESGEKRQTRRRRKRGKKKSKRAAESKQESAAEAAEEPEAEVSDPPSPSQDGAAAAKDVTDKCPFPAGSFKAKEWHRRRKRGAQLKQLFLGAGVVLVLLVVWVVWMKRG